MTKYLIYFNLLFLSTLYASDMVKVKIKSGHIGRGEWIGTYSGHIHLLIEDKVYYYACDEILSVMVDDKTNIEEAFVFDCSENTVSSDILFPPEINPMTGEWTQNIPDIFNPDIPKLVEREKTEVVEIDNSVMSPEITEPPAKIEETTFWIDNEEIGSESQETAKNEDVTQDDFIIINGVKYVRASSDQSTDQNDFAQLKREDFIISKSTIRSMAREDATRNHNNVTWGVAGLGSCVTGMFGAGIGAGVAGFPGFLLGGIGGFLLPYSSANNYNPKLNYPDEIMGLNEKETLQRYLFETGSNISKTIYE
ncbi:MAG: hypothetical protein CM15mP87_09510 [Candidatus Neomarinimicrobiota bacterium]|nr:MAG: hypothetical protein CM15mP87_09510 [Candidatus Neomarinimicrobiota bacterium]